MLLTEVHFTENNIIFLDFSPDQFSMDNPELGNRVTMKSYFMYDTDIHMDGCTSIQITFYTRYNYIII